MKSPVVCLGAERQPSDARDADGCEPCLHRSRARRAEDVVRSLRCPRGIHRGRVLTDNDMGTVPIQFFPPSCGGETAGLCTHPAAGPGAGRVGTHPPHRTATPRPHPVSLPATTRLPKPPQHAPISNDKTPLPLAGAAHVALTEPLARSISSPDRPHSLAHTCHPHRAAPARVIS